MWQRIQTLYLLIAMLINAALFKLELAAIIIDGHWSHSFELSGVYVDGTKDSIFSSLTLNLLLALSILLSLVVILMYKKRQLQIKLSQLNLFLQAFLVAAIFYFVEDSLVLFKNSESVSVEYSLGTYLSLLPLLFIYLAIRGIKKDEALVRAADRIR